MDAHSSARSTHEYQPTIIETRFLIERLALQLALLRDEFKLNWIEFKRNPIKFSTCLIRELLTHLKKFASTPYALRALSTAITAVVCMVIIVVLIERSGLRPGHETDHVEQAPVEVVLLSVEKVKDAPGIGKNGTGRVGFQSGNGEGSGPARKLAQGGGGGGDRNPLPAQVGEIPPPSPIPAAIPVAPPINPPALPAAGIDLDPALWQDLKEPVYGNPLSASETPSKGPGTGGGIGSNEGLGIRDGRGSGFGPGADGNTGGGTKQIGCCGSGGASGEGGGAGGENMRGYGGGGVDQRARLLFKPEPQYTEEARRNQITGTVVLRVVFASSGEVVQIRATRTLPFGLTERAIAAARQIRFVPAMKDGRPVPVSMQLEYNFNLY
jgi:TonB family protein